MLITLDKFCADISYAVTPTLHNLLRVCSACSVSICTSHSHPDLKCMKNTVPLIEVQVFCRPVVQSLSRSFKSAKCQRCQVTVTSH